MLITLLAPALTVTGCSVSSDSAKSAPGPSTFQHSSAAPDTSEGEATESAPPVPSTALQALDRLPVIPRAELAQDYRRAQFGSGWIDTDGNGCSQRDDVLLRDARRDRDLVVVRQGNCDHDVVAGTWLDPYSGREITFTDLKDPEQSQSIQIDHVVSLSDAWATGAWAWTPEQRISFANDLDNLVAVDGPTNQAKSDQGPPDWLPDANRCWYVESYVFTKDAHALGISEDAMVGLRDLLNQCG